MFLKKIYVSLWTFPSSIYFQAKKVWPLSSEAIGELLTFRYICQSWRLNLCVCRISVHICPMYLLVDGTWYWGICFISERCSQRKEIWTLAWVWRVAEWKTMQTRAFGEIICEYFCNLMGYSAVVMIFNEVKCVVQLWITSGGPRSHLFLYFFLNHILLKAGHIVFPLVADKWNAPHSKERSSNNLTEFNNIGGI